MAESVVSALLAQSTPRLLVLAPRYPYPVIGGDRLRIHHLCAVLAASYRLTLLSMSEEPAGSIPAPPEGIFEEVETVPLKRWRSRLNCLFALPTREPLQLAYYSSPAFAERVAELAPRHDAILCHLIRAADYALPFDMPRILEMTDAISLNYKRVKETASPVKVRSLIYGLEQARLEAFEREIVDRFDAAVLVSDTDRRFLFADDPARAEKVMVCSNGVDTADLPFQFSRACTDRIVFIGNVTTLQNLDAVEWFATDVLPKIAAERPGVVFEVVGHIGRRESRRLSAFPRVRVIGDVPSIAPAVAGAAVAVCPVRLGAGVQNKLLEYMALGLPSVTTKVGLEGIAAEPNRHLLLADSAQEMARAVLRVLTDRRLAWKLAAAARSFVERNHRWAGQFSPLVRQIDRLISRRQLREAALHGRSRPETRAQDLQRDLRRRSAGGSG